jgi:hypothetical protein
MDTYLVVYIHVECGELIVGIFTDYTRALLFYDTLAEVRKGIRKISTENGKATANIILCNNTFEYATNVESIDSSF